MNEINNLQEPADGIRAHAMPQCQCWSCQVVRLISMPEPKAEASQQGAGQAEQAAQLSPQAARPAGMDGAARGEGALNEKRGAAIGGRVPPASISGSATPDAPHFGSADRVPFHPTLPPEQGPATLSGPLGSPPTGSPLIFHPGPDAWVPPLFQLNIAPPMPYKPNPDNGSLLAAALRTRLAISETDLAQAHVQLKNQAHSIRIYQGNDDFLKSLLTTRDSEIADLQSKLHDTDQALADSEERVASYRDLDAVYTERLRKAESDAKSCADRSEGLRRNCDALAGQLNRSTEVVLALEDRLDKVGSDNVSIRTQLHGAVRARDIAVEMGKKQAAEIGGLTEEVHTQHQRILAAEHSLRNRQCEAGLLQAVIADKDTKIERLETELRDAAAKSSYKDSRLTELGDALESVGKRNGELRAELDRASDREQELNRSVASLVHELRSAKEELAHAQADLAMHEDPPTAEHLGPVHAELQQRYDMLVGAMARTNAELSRTRNECAQLKSHIAGMANIEYYTDIDPNVPAPAGQRP